MRQRKATACLAGCLVIVTLAGQPYAKDQDVTKGITIERALHIVKQCVIEATSFRDPRAQTYKELRAQDTLEYAGVTDATRLKALRRFLVRNTAIGVPSLTGRRGQRSDPYLLPIAALSDLKKSTTLEQLARSIVKDAGLPYLTYSKAAQIVANSRGEVKPGIYDKPFTTTKISLDMSSTEIDHFKTVLLYNRKKGVESAGLVDGEGNSHRYKSDSVRTRIETLLASPDSTYGDLVQAIYEDAAI